MHTKIQELGNSQGLHRAKDVLQEAILGVGDEVDVAVRDGTIIIAPVIETRRRHRLEDLVAKIPDDYHAKEVDWGGPVCKEVW